MLHDHIWSTVSGGAEVEHRDDIGVVDLAGRLGFLLEYSDLLRVAEMLDLDHDSFVEEKIPAEVDTGTYPGAELGYRLVALFRKLSRGKLYRGLFAFRLDRLCHRIGGLGQDLSLSRDSGRVWSIAITGVGAKNPLSERSCSARVYSFAAAQTDIETDFGWTLQDFIPEGIALTD